MSGGVRKWCSVGLMIVNGGMFVALCYLFLARGGDFAAPWSGPDLATVALTAATLVLACVALFVAILAIWGYASIRTRAEELAREAAREVAVPEAQNAVRALLSAAVGSGQIVQGQGSSDVRDAFKDGG